MCRCGECFGCTLTADVEPDEGIFSQSDWLEMLLIVRAIEYGVIEFNPDRKEANCA